jgi:hypothetical protein
MDGVSYPVGSSLRVPFCTRRSALRARSKFRAVGRRFETSLVEVCVVGVSAILINAYFDPTLESPQVAIWLWTLVGVTLGLAALARRGLEITTARPLSRTGRQL